MGIKSESVGKYSYSALTNVSKVLHDLLVSDDKHIRLKTAITINGIRINQRSLIFTPLECEVILLILGGFLGRKSDDENEYLNNSFIQEILHTSLYR